MGNKIFFQNKWYDNVLDWWRRRYCLVIPSVATMVFLIYYYKERVPIWNSKNYVDTLSSVITFVSIIISFFGVLLTLLISAKEKSQLIKDFLASADIKVFISSIKRLIMFGLLSVIDATVLFLEDILPNKLIVVLLATAIFSLIKFTALTYRFTNILLMLFINSDEGKGKPQGESLSEERTKELKERIRNGI